LVIFFTTKYLSNKACLPVVQPSWLSAIVARCYKVLDDLILLLGAGSKLLQGSDDLILLLQSRQHNSYKAVLSFSFSKEKKHII